MERAGGKRVLRLGDRKAYGQPRIERRERILEDHLMSRRTFCRSFLNPYVNFHRHGYFATDEIDAKGKIRKRYPHALIITPSTSWSDKLTK